jgi:hypothetical protein
MARVAEPVAIFGRLDALTYDVNLDEWWFDNEICEIGRDPGAHLVMSREDVSRHHARIQRAGAAHFLEDLGSANGTYLDGERITRPMILADCDDIGFGRPEPILRFREFEPYEVPPVRPKFEEATNRFLLGGQALALTDDERALLHVLWEHYQQICDRATCGHGIWGANHPPSLQRNALDRIVDGLRDKIRRVNPTGNPIHPVASGFILTDLGAPPAE